MKSFFPGIAKQSSGVQRPLKEQIDNEQATGKKPRKKLKSSIQYSTRNSSFCEVSVGHDMYTDTSKAAKFKPIFQAPSESPHFGGKML